MRHYEDGFYDDDPMGEMDWEEGIADSHDEEKGFFGNLFDFPLQIFLPIVLPFMVVWLMAGFPHPSVMIRDLANGQVIKMYNPEKQAIVTISKFVALLNRIKFLEKQRPITEDDVRDLENGHPKDVEEVVHGNPIVVLTEKVTKLEPLRVLNSGYDVVIRNQDGRVINYTATGDTIDVTSLPLTDAVYIYFDGRCDTVKVHDNLDPLVDITKVRQSKDVFDIRLDGQDLKTTFLRIPHIDEDTPLDSLCIRLDGDLMSPELQGCLDFNTSGGNANFSLNKFPDIRTGSKKLSFRYWFWTHEGYEVKSPQYSIIVKAEGESILKDIGKVLPWNWGIFKKKTDTKNGG